MATQDEEAELEASKAPLLDHLIELRTRLVNSCIAFLIAFLVCFYYSRPIYAFLVQPLADQLHGPGRQMIFTQVYEQFFTYAKVGMFGGLCLAFPFMAWQLWMFIAPGLYRNERKAFLPFIIATPVMFIIGAGFVYYLLLPNAIRFFLSYETHPDPGSTTIAIEMVPRVSEYLSFITTLIFAFGLCFELPVLLALLGRVGIVTSKGLRSVWRYAVVGVFILAAVLTPPDVFSQLSLAIPLVGLYEVSIWIVKAIEKNRAKADAEAEAAQRGGGVQPT